MVLADAFGALSRNKAGELSWNCFEGSCSKAKDFELYSRGISEPLIIFKPGNGIMWSVKT